MSLKLISPSGSPIPPKFPLGWAVLPAFVRVQWLQQEMKQQDLCAAVFINYQMKITETSVISELLKM